MSDMQTYTRNKNYPRRGTDGMTANQFGGAEDVLRY